MRKFALHSTILLLLTVLLVGPGAAQQSGTSVPQSPHDYLSGLAAYAPHDTMLYAAVRTDDDAIAALNALTAEFAAGLPGVTIPSVEELIDSTSLSFAELRPWLGESIAIAMTPNNDVDYDSFAGAVILHLADPEAAEAFLTPQLGGAGVEWRNDVAIIGDQSVLDAIEASEYPNLHQQPMFNDAIRALDAPDYAAMIYVDLPVIQARARGARMQYYSDITTQIFATTALARLMGATALGVTRGEDGDLLMDVAMTAPNLAGILPLGIELRPASVSPEALAFAPHDSFAVLHGVNLPGVFLEAYRVFGTTLIESTVDLAMQMSLRFNLSNPFELALLSGLDGEQAAELVLGNLLGISMSDLQNWTSSDYVIFTRVNPNWDPVFYSPVLPVDVGAIFSIGDAAQSYAAFENLARSLLLLRESAAGWRYIDIGVNRATDANNRHIMSRIDLKLHTYGPDAPPVVVSFAVTDSIAVLGTSGAVDAALAQQGGETAPWLSEASAHFRPGAAFNGALQPSALVPVLTAWMNNAQAADAVRPFLAKLDALTFNSLMAANGASITRFTVSLNDAGAVETILGRPTLEPLGSATPPPLPTLDPVILAVTATANALTNVPPRLPTLTPVAPETTADIVATATAVVLEATPTMSHTPPPTFTPTFVPTQVPTNTETPPPTPVPTETTAATATLLPTAVAEPGLAFRGDDGAFTLGSPDAPVTLVVFVDWMCPHCYDYKTTVDQFIASEVAEGLANFEHRTLPTAGGDATRVAANFAECADQQQPGLFFAVSDALFEIARNEASLYRSGIALAATLSRRFNLDNDLLVACAEEAAQGATDRDYAVELGVNSTPAVYVRAADGTILPLGDRTLEGIRAALRDLPGGAGPTGPTGATESASDATPNQATRLAVLAATRAAATPSQ